MNRDWLVPGRTVYVLDSSNHGGFRIRQEKVDRITKTLVVLSDGTRWNLSTLRPVKIARDGGYNMWTSEVVPVTDPRVGIAKCQRQWRRIVAIVEDERRKSHTDQDSIDAAMRRVHRALGCEQA